MAEQKMKPTGASVEEFLEGIADEGRRADCRALVRIMKKATREQPKVWGGGMMGFGEYHYRYASGHEGDCFLAGFAPRKDSLTLYLMSGFDGAEAELRKLGKHKTGRACLYIKRLADVDEKVLAGLVAASVQRLKESHPKSAARR